MRETMREAIQRTMLSIPVFVVALLAFVGCESEEVPTVPMRADLRLKPALRVPDESEASAPRIVEVKVPVPSPQLRPTSVLRPSAPPTTGPAAIAAAKAAATVPPTGDGFLNAIQYYDYAPGVVYSALTSPGFVTTLAHGIVGPAGIPPALVATLNRDINTALGNPEYRRQMRDDGVNIVGGPPEQFQAFLAGERKRWSPLIQKLGLRAE